MSKDLPDAPGITRLLAVMARLRDPNGGCPWDLEQDFASIAPYTIEEAYEVADAIAENDMAQLRDELGDLLLQVVFHARMAEEAAQFDFDQVAGGIADKMIRRHPHVFGDTDIASAGAQTLAWEEQKAQERQAKAAARGGEASSLDGVATGLPALTRALKLQKRAARVGFDWPSVAPVFAKIGEEIDELQEALAAEAAPFRVAEELGDLLFSVVNAARHLEVDPEEALRAANRKFEHRFRQVEAGLSAQGRQASEVDLDILEALWVKAKAATASK